MATGDIHGPPAWWGHPSLGGTRCTLKKAGLAASCTRETEWRWEKDGVDTEKCLSATVTRVITAGYLSTFIFHRCIKGWMQKICHPSEHGWNEKCLYKRIWVMRIQWDMVTFAIQNNDESTICTSPKDSFPMFSILLKRFYGKESSDPFQVSRHISPTTKSDCEAAAIGMRQPIGVISALIDSQAGWPLRMGCPWDLCDKNLVISQNKM